MQIFFNTFYLIVTKACLYFFFFLMNASQGSMLSVLVLDSWFAVVEACSSSLLFEV